MLGSLELEEEVAESGQRDGMRGIKQPPLHDVLEDKDQEEYQGDNQAEGTLTLDVEEARVDEEEVEKQIISCPPKVQSQSPTL